jgi:predicted phage tail protein
MKRVISAFAIAVLLAGCALAPPAPKAHPSAPLYHAAFGATSCVAGQQGISPVATLTFTPPTTNTDGTPVNGPLTFNLYQSTSPGTETKVQSGITASPDVINAGLKGGTTYYFELTAVDASGTESARSNEACKAMAPSEPNSFVITIQ